MADSITNIPQISFGLADKETQVNELFDAASPIMLFGRNALTTAGLTWGYLGGRIYIDGAATAKPNGTVALSASSTNYIEVDITGAVSKNTTGFSPDKAPLYTATTDANVITDYQDHRNPMTLLRLFYGRTTVAMGDANKTLTFAQAACDSLEFTGALTALRDVIVPTVKRPYTIYDNTTGGFGIRVKTAAGTGITVADGDRVTLECDGTNVVKIGSSAVNFTGGTLTSALNEAPQVTLASAATVAIGAAGANGITITGTTTITAFDTIAAGAIRHLTFSGALTLTHNATSLILPSGANITTAAGDTCEAESLGSGNWRIRSYQRADGKALVASISGAATLSAVNVFTKNQSVSPAALTSGATIAVDASLSNNLKLTLGTNATLSNPTNPTDGMVVNVRIKQDATGGRTLAYGSAYKWPGGSAPALSTAANAVDLISMYYDATDAVWECVMQKGFA